MEKSYQMEGEQDERVIGVFTRVLKTNILFPSTQINCDNASFGESPGVQFPIKWISFHLVYTGMAGLCSGGGKRESK